MKEQIIKLINLIQSDEALFLLHDFILNDVLPNDRYLLQFEADKTVGDETLALKAQVIELIASADKDKVKCLYQFVKEYLK